LCANDDQSSDAEMCQERLEGSVLKGVAVALLDEWLGLARSQLRDDPPDADAVGVIPVALEPAFPFSSPPGYSGDLPCPGKGAAIKSHNDEDQSALQCGTLGVRQERYGEAELR
jgi:hypothetical protein